MRVRELFEYKRLIDITSILVIVGAWLFFSSLDEASRVAAAGFSDFPVGVSQTIEFNADETFDEASPRKKMEQMRDWLVFTLISSAGLSAEDATQATFDLPAVRREYLEPVSRFDHGDARSAFIGDGLVVALIPPRDEKVKSDMLARIADEHRKNLGTIPEQIAVFEYIIHLDEQAGTASAEVTQRETLDARKLFTSEAGYYTKAISNADDLKAFLGQVDTLTYADTHSGLTLGGRKLRGETYLGVGFEDIAAIWQSDAAGSEKQGSGFSLDPTYDFASLKTLFDQRIAPVLRACLDEPISSSAWSLPWTPHLPQYPRNRFTESPLNGRLTTGLVYQGDRIEKAGDALQRGDIDPLLKLFGELSRSRNDFALKIAAIFKIKPDQLGTAYLQYVDEMCGFQKARYDGTLQSTSVGMTLFYTDLLAKLWMFDYLNSTPANRIDDFYPEFEIAVSPAHKDERIRLANTRLWFGPQDKGYQVADGGKELLLARTAARVYAAGSDPLEPSKEGAASTQSAAFLNWWDSHYDEIARFEPQYQRLNEIMKWSLLTGWIHRQGGIPALNFLTTPQVHDSRYRFPDWVKTQPNLRFTGWGDSCQPGTRPSATQKFTNVRFFPKGYKNSTTEALPLLQSRDFDSYGEKGWVLTGGVSLGGKAVFTGRTALSESTVVGRLLRRSWVDYSLAEGTAEARVLKTFEGVNYRLSSAGERAVVSGTAKQGVELRDIYGGSGKDLTVERSLERTTEGLSIKTNTQGLPVGDLQIARSGNGFRVGYASREIDTAQTLARQISRANDPASVVASSSKVEAYIRVPGMQHELVKLKGSEQWLQIGREASSDAGPHLRVADLGSSSHPYDLNWIRAEDAMSKLGKDGDVVIRLAGKEGVVRVETVAGKIPEGTVQFEHTVNGAVIRGRLNPNLNELYIARRDLTVSVLKDPVELSRAIQGKPPESTLAAALRRGDYRAVIQDIAKDPLSARTNLSRHLEEGLSEGRNLLEQGKYDRALEQFDMLIDVHGAHPELRTLRALARLNKRSPAVAGSVKDGMLTADGRGGTALLDEINLRLRTGGLTPPRDMLEILSVRNNVTLAYKTPRLSNLTRTAPLSINRPAVILIEDSQGLNNLNWHVNTLSTLEDAVRLRLGDLYKVSNLKLGNFRPSMLIVEEERVAGSLQPVQRFQAYYPRVLYRNSNCDQEGRMKGDCEPDVYVFIAGKVR